MHRTNPPQDAEILGLQALAWLAADPDVLERFTNGCGIDAAALRAAADQPDTLVAVIDFLLADEALVLAFCGDSQLRPQALHQARRRLAGDS